jgi:hypothetical protein
MRSHMTQSQLSLDPAEATSEIWGESFEGCAPDYASAFAVGLGLTISPGMRFERTVFDSRFIKRGRLLETISVVNSDVEVVLFELYDGTFAAIYQARLTPQRLDSRSIRLSLDSTRIQVCTKQGHTVWPAEPWKKGDPAVWAPYQLTTRNYYWVRGITIGLDEFRKVIAAAAVGEERRRI